MAYPAGSGGRKCLLLLRARINLKPCTFYFIPYTIYLFLYVKTCFAVNSFFLLFILSYLHLPPIISTKNARILTVPFPRITWREPSIIFFQIRTFPSFTSKAMGGSGSQSTYILCRSFHASDIPTSQANDIDYQHCCSIRHSGTLFILDTGVVGSIFFEKGLTV